VVLFDVCKTKDEKNWFLAERSFDLRTSGLWAQHASTAPLCYPCLVESKISCRFGLLLKKERHTHTMDRKKEFVSCEIRTHAHRSGLRPERSALDHSAKLTVVPWCRQPQATTYAYTLCGYKVLSPLTMCRPVSSVG
jgi:hypothetical protein